MDLPDRLFGHDRSTTTRYLDLCKGLSEEQWDQEFDVGWRTLRATFDHIFESLDFWVGCMSGVPSTRQPGTRTHEQFQAEHTAGYERFEALARKLIAEGRLDDEYDDAWGVPRSFGTTILHLTTHNQTHLTEVLHILERLGVSNLPEGDLLEWEWSLRAR